jgi:hypothetical protein
VPLEEKVRLKYLCSDGLGKGSEFIVRLAVAEVKDQGRQGAACEREKGAAPAKRRILVVDDNRDAADSLGMLLRMMGNKVHTAHDGLEAVGAAVAFQPDVVLLDLGLPKRNGYEAVRRIREQDGGTDMVLVAVTRLGPGGGSSPLQGSRFRSPHDEAGRVYCKNCLLRAIRARRQLIESNRGASARYARSRPFSERSLRSPRASKGLGSPAKIPVVVTGRRACSASRIPPAQRESSSAGNDEDEVDPLGHAQLGGLLEVDQVVVPPARGAVLTRGGIALRVPGCQMAVDPAAPHELAVLVGAGVGVEVTRENGRLQHSVPVLYEERHPGLTLPHGVHQGYAFRGTCRRDQGCGHGRVQPPHRGLGHGGSPVRGAHPRCAQHGDLPPAAAGCDPSFRSGHSVQIQCFRSALQRGSHMTLHGPGRRLFR